MLSKHSYHLSRCRGRNQLFRLLARRASGIKCLLAQEDLNLPEKKKIGTISFEVTLEKICEMYFLTKSSEFAR